jgi:drug/metabolite transporter (DMT)-like permease
MPDRATLVAFATFVLIGGFNFVAVRFSNRELAPMFGAGVRFTIAALILLAVVALRRLPVARGRALKAAVLYGLLNFTAAYGLAYWALTTLPAGIGAVVFAATPLFTVFLAPLHGIERFRVRGLVGSLITLVGIVILANPTGADRLPWLALLAMLGSAAAAAEAGVVLKLLPSAHPISTNALAMAIGGPLLLVVSGLIGETWALPTEAETWVAVSYLAVIGSVGLFGLFLFVLRRWSATGTSYATAIIPVITVIVGSLLASEPITVAMVIGGAIVLVGVYIGALAGKAKDAAATVTV